MSDWLWHEGRLFYAGPMTRELTHCDRHLGTWYADYCLYCRQEWNALPWWRKLWRRVSNQESKP